MVRFVGITRLSTLLICFILTDPKVHRAPGGFNEAQDKSTGDNNADDAAAASDVNATLLSTGGGGGNCLAKAATATTGTGPTSEDSVEVSSPLPVLDVSQNTADGSKNTTGFTVGNDDGKPAPASQGERDGEDDGLSVPKVQVVGFKEQCAQIWDAMHQDRIWRPMIFICIWALVPGNGDAFNSFTQGCASACSVISLTQSCSTCLHLVLATIP
eukprot:COSAG02_NODE_163_length_32424_cov_21.759010_8_plen_214_part_00